MALHIVAECGHMIRWLAVLVMDVYFRETMIMFSTTAKKSFGLFISVLHFRIYFLYKTFILLTVFILILITLVLFQPDSKHFCLDQDPCLHDCEVIPVVICMRSPCKTLFKDPFSSCLAWQKLQTV